ncbi:MAG: hypothetical protein ACXWUB_08080 [Burkholderiales bacterium]
MNAPWFDPNLYAWIPGTVLGVVGGTLGALTGTLAPRGKARTVMLGLHVAAIAASFALLVAAIIALATGQPYGIWYGFGLPGVLGVVVLGLLYPVIRQRYREAEARRLRAADLG